MTARRTYLELLAAVAISGCSTLEPSLEIPAENPGSYSVEKQKAEVLIKTMQQKRKSVQREDVAYTFAGFGAGLAATVAGIYDAHRDLVMGLATGAATSGGLNAYLSPGEIAKSYSKGATAVQCAIRATEALHLKAATARGLTGYSAYSIGKTVFQNFAPYSASSATTITWAANEGPEALSAARSTLAALTRMHAAINSYFLAVDALRNFDEAEAGKLLHDAVVEIILKLNKAIESRTRDLDALEPGNIKAKAEQLGNVQKSALQSLRLGQAYSLGVSGSRDLLMLRGIQAAYPDSDLLFVLKNADGLLLSAQNELDNLEVPESPFADCMGEFETGT